MLLLVILRVLVLALLFLLSLLVVFPAQTTMAWLLAIIATEWGYIIATIAFFMIAIPWRTRGALRNVGIGLGLITIVLSVIPIVQAFPILRLFDTQLRTAFGPHATLDTRYAIQSGTITYRTDSTSAPLGIDIYRPVSKTRAPLVLMIHGGSWSGGGRQDLAPLNSYLAERGYVVATMSYRLAPAHPFPAAIQDVRAALAQLKYQSATLGIDSSRIVLVGRSAGGELALLTAYTANDPSVRGAVGFYAPVDLKYGYDHPSNPRVFNSRNVLRAYLGGSPGQTGDAYDAASPIRFVTATTVPTLLIHGSRDELVSVEQSNRLSQALSAAGRPYLFLRLPWATHGCDYNFQGPCGRISRHAVIGFLAAVTK